MWLLLLLVGTAAMNHRKEAPTGRQTDANMLITQSEGAQEGTVCSHCRSASGDRYAAAISPLPEWRPEGEH